MVYYIVYLLSSIIRGDMMLVKSEKKQISFNHLTFEKTYTEMMECDKCGLMYPILEGKVKCNGKEITKCLCEEVEYKNE